MTYQNNFTLPGELLEQITTEGFDILPARIDLNIDQFSNTGRTTEIILN